MKRILITGGTGFFGKSILDYHRRHPLGELTMLSRHPDVFIRAFPELAHLDGVIFHAGDVRDFDLPGERFDVVIHAAAAVVAPGNDAAVSSVILGGTRHTLDFAKECGCQKFMFISSGAVYGKGFHTPISEEIAPHPVTTYGKTKWEAEQMCIVSGLSVLLPRCFAFVGFYLERNAHFAIGNFIRDCLANRPIVINGNGTPLRSYLYADDLVEWLWEILEQGRSGRPYNVGSDESVSIRSLAETVRRVVGSRNEIRVLGQAVSGAADYYVPDIERARSELGLRITTKLEDAIRRSL